MDSAVNFDRLIILLAFLKVELLGAGALFVPSTVGDETPDNECGIDDLGIDLAFCNVLFGIRLSCERR